MDPIVSPPVIFAAIAFMNHYTFSMSTNVFVLLTFLHSPIFTLSPTFTSMQGGLCALILVLRLS
jgi:ABC-type multidrug transport system permease subunit